VLFERIQSVGLSYKKSACKGKRKGMITSLPTTRISATSQWQTFLKSFTHKMAAKASWHQNWVAVSLHVCIESESAPKIITNSLTQQIYFLKLQMTCNHHFGNFKP